MSREMSARSHSLTSSLLAELDIMIDDAADRFRDAYGIEELTDPSAISQVCPSLNLHAIASDRPSRRNRPTSLAASSLHRQIRVNLQTRPCSWNLRERWATGNEHL